MSKRVTADRPISPTEIAVIQAMLARGAVAPAYEHLSEGIESLRVTDRCGCGCDSVEFKASDPEHRPTPIADGSGVTAAGGQVGVIIWGTARAVSGIEVYEMGCGGDDIRLPVPESIRPWESHD